MELLKITMTLLAWLGVTNAMWIAPNQSEPRPSRFAERLKPSNGWQETVREPLRPPQGDPGKALYDARERWADRVLGLGMPLDELYERGFGSGGSLGPPSGLKMVPEFPDRVVVLARFAGYDFVLTKSRFALYSEMYLSVERVLDQGGTDIGPGTRLTALIPGGTVRLPNGRVLQHAVKPLPFVIAPGHRYLMYLRHVADGDFYFVTKTVEFIGGKAFPNSYEDVQNAEKGTWPFVDQDEETVLREVEGILRKQKGGN